MSDNRTTELLHKLLDERGVKYETNADECCYGEQPSTTWDFNLCGLKMTVTAKEFVDIEGKTYLEMDFLHAFTPEQAIAATLGVRKAKAHPYGYELDTGAFDVTRCECGCLNDISATYCNDCGGEIEIDMNAEKEIYCIPRHLVFAVKHDDGSLEFAGNKYVTATRGGEVYISERTCIAECHDCGDGVTGLYCSECGNYIDENDNYCPSCGAKVTSE